MVCHIVMEEGTAIVYWFLPIRIHFLCWLLNSLVVWIFSHFDSSFVKLYHADHEVWPCYLSGFHWWVRCQAYTRYMVILDHHWTLLCIQELQYTQELYFCPQCMGRVVGAYVFRNRVGIASLNLWVFISLFICSLVHVFELVSTRPLLVSCICSF